VNIHEEKFIRSFVRKEKQGRYLEFLPSEKNRWKVTSRFDHSDDFDTALAIQIPPAQQKPDVIVTILRDAGAGELCWILSSNDDIDGKEMPLEFALREHLFREGTFFSCIPGELVLYSGEDINAIWVFKNRRGAT